MVVTQKPLFALTAGDLMSRTLVMVPEEMSLEGAARLLSRSQVSGAPVVNKNGKCTGVLSATDFIHFAEKGPRAAKHCPCSEDSGVYSWQIIESEDLPEDAVRNYMTAFPVVVSPETNVGELARMMIDAHIHRVIVAEPDGKPQGIVSSTDILAAVARSYQAQSIDTCRCGEYHSSVDEEMYFEG
jgi:CBS domain-containing protein